MASVVEGLNFFEADQPLISCLQTRLSDRQWTWAQPTLSSWGELCGGPIARRAEVIDKNPPTLEAQDRWGNPARRVVHHPYAIETKRDLCEAGYTGFTWQSDVKDDPERRLAAGVISTVFNYMLNQSDTGMACACGMTAGVARVIDIGADEPVRQRFLPGLTTTNFDQLIDGAMFMTERSGGSDLSSTSTTATRSGDQWRLTGEKWFCSNVDGKAILTLARADGSEEGTRGLSLFLVPAQNDDGSDNSYKIRRIKDKLGTRSVPTGEVLFDGASAYQIGEASGGLQRMMEMVNYSRLGVAMMGAGIARRTVLEAALYAVDRKAFGKPIRDHPMVRETLLEMQVEAEAALVMCLEAAIVGGRVIAGAASDSEGKFLRILTPLAKIRAARTGLQNAIEAVEIFGGNGYIEDWPVARQLRDAQCHTIWEGTENVNSLDVLRAMLKQKAHEGLFTRVEKVLELAEGPDAEVLSSTLEEARAAVADVAAAPEALARKFANFLCDLVGASLLVEHAFVSGSERVAAVARLYIDARLRSLPRFKNGAGLADGAFDLVVPPFGI